VQGLSSLRTVLFPEGGSGAKSWTASQRLAARPETFCILVSIGRQSSSACGSCFVSELGQRLNVGLLQRSQHRVGAEQCLDVGSPEPV
jgi:hypothetical protein